MTSCINEMSVTTDDLSTETQANLVLQVNRSHLDRMEDFLKDHYVKATATQPSDGGGSDNGNDDDAAQPDTDPTPTVEILTTKRYTASQSCSLIFVRTSDDKAFVEHMMDKYKFVLHGLNKIYFMTSGRSIMRGDFRSIKKDEVSAKDADVVGCNTHHLVKILQDLQTDYSSPTRKTTLVKLEVYPASLQRKVVANVTTLLDAKGIPENELDITPSNQTHTVTVMRMDEKGTYLVGIAPADRSAYTINKPEAANDVCRAYYKLSEAFERYRCHNKESTFFCLPPSSELQNSGSKRKTSCLEPIVAVDCGAAPGGWTKYLLEQTAVDEVYSIDPAKLDPAVMAMEDAHHMKMQALTAIPELKDILAKRDNDGKIALWVSDMCIHDIPKQVNTFLAAYEAGIFRENSAFVLTIKCNIGHAKERFDKHAEDECVRLKEAGAYDMNVIHLLSNRISERTIIGFIK